MVIKMNKKQFIPNIRFHGFTDGWAQRRLVDEVDFFSGLTYSPDNIVKEGGTFVLRSSNVQNGEIVEADNVYVEHEAVNSTNVQVGDIVIVVRNGSRSLIGKHAAIKKPMENTVIGAFMTGIHSETSSFINALLDTRQFEIEIHKNLGATINQITTGNFKKMEFNFPTKFEQEKTGSFFKELDDTITLQQQLLDDYKQLKKAMLQKMFPQKGESVPRIRFARFTDDWEQKEMGELAKIKTGKKDVQDADENGIYPFYIRSDEIKKINSYSFDGEAILVPGEGRLGDIIHYIKGKFDFHQRVYKISDFDGVSALYLLYFMKLNFKRHAMKYTVKATVDSLRLPMLKEFKILLPKLAEQEKIGNYFKQLDETIVLHEKKLETYQNLKKAMLQKMFV